MQRGMCSASVGFGQQPPSNDLRHLFVSLLDEMSGLPWDSPNCALFGGNFRSELTPSRLSTEPGGVRFEWRPQALSLI
jgi:hypothetical protein